METAEAIHADFTELRDVIPRVPLEKFDDPEYFYPPELILKGMNDIEEKLAGVGLAHLEPFNKVYRELTGRVVKHARDSQENPGDKEAFHHPETVIRTIGIFADFYFKQLRAYTGATTEEVDPAWQFLLYRSDTSNADPEIRPYAEQAKTEDALEGIQFLLGMNAHINYDLAQALCLSGVTEDYYKDYRRVIGMLINLTAKELSPDYIPGPRFTRPALQWITERVIAHWRNRAWRTGKNLLKASEDEVAMEAILAHLSRTSVRTGERLITHGTMALNGLAKFQRRSQLATAA